MDTPHKKWDLWHAAMELTVTSDEITEDLTKLEA